jgi:D-glycero-alpha-D-manno-heptose 1-phosphate guanylyltransferase
MRLLILAGGFGTRLKSEIADLPKALAPVCGVPFLELQIENWLSQGLRNFTFLLHHKSEQIIAFLRSRQDDLLKECKVDWVVEPNAFGTGGALAYAVTVLGLQNNFLITNADTWLGGGMNEMMHSKSPSIAVIKVPDVGRYGQVNFDQKNSVVAFTEKNALSESGWINAGLYHLSADLFSDWKKQHFSLEDQLFPKLVRDGLLSVVPLETNFIDIGVPVDYHRFCRWIGVSR